MFGMGFTEILLIAIVAIIALGPEKLPNAMVEIAKMIKKFKSGIEDAKSTLDDELNLKEMKEEAAKYRAQIEDAKSILDSNEDLNVNNILKDDDTDKKEKKSLKKKDKKTSKQKEETKIENENSEETNKFKVNFDEENNGDNK